MEGDCGFLGSVMGLSDVEMEVEGKEVLMVAGMAWSEVPFAVGWEGGRGLAVVVVEGVDMEVFVFVFVVGVSTTAGETSLLLPGTSRLCRRGLRSFVMTGLLVWMGNRVSGPPLERSRRWPRPGVGWGLLARLREAMARFRASMLARRLLSSVLMARSRPAPEVVWLRVLARFSSPKMASLWSKRSRMRR